MLLPESIIGGGLAGALERVKRCSLESSESVSESWFGLATIRGPRGLRRTERREDAEGALTRSAVKRVSVDDVDATIGVLRIVGGDTRK